MLHDDDVWVITIVMYAYMIQITHYYVLVSGSVISQQSCKDHQVASSQCVMMSGC